MNPNSCYRVLDHLQSEGLLESWESDSHSQGGRPRRTFALTEAGQAASFELNEALFGLMIGQALADHEPPDSGPIASALQMLLRLRSFLPDVTDTDGTTDAEKAHLQNLQIQLLYVLKQLRPLRSLDKVFTEVFPPELAQRTHSIPATISSSREARSE